jgi:hypothetical protein
VVDDDALDDDFDLDVQTAEDYRDLIRRHDTIMARTRRTLQHHDDLYEGDMPLKYMAPAVAAQFGDRITQLVINIADLVVESYENRLDIDGIRLDPKADADDNEAQTWEELDMALVQQQVHMESLALGRCMTAVGVDDEDNPVVTAESPFQMTTILDPLRQTKSAVKRWKADDGRTNMRTLYLPNETLHWVQSGRSWDLSGDFERNEHGLGRVPVFTFLNRARLLQGLGSPEFKKIIPIYEALNKMSTDMMVAGEFHALPRRWAVNVAPEDFVDEQGKPLTPLEQIVGAIWNIPAEKGGEPVQLGQFAASDLSNFHNTIKLLLQVAGHIMGLPAAYTSFASDNPAAEGAIKAGEIQLIKGSERKQVTLGAPWKRTWQTVMQIRNGGTLPDEAKRLQIMWRDPATPTKAQNADAVSKLVSTTNKQGIPVITIGAAREMMGFSAAQRDSMAVEDAAALRAGVAAIRDTFTPEFSDAS